MNQVGVRNGSTSGVTYQSNGANNFGYFFDGNDYVDFGANFFLNGLSEMTMCTWFNVTSLASNREIISYQDGSNIGNHLTVGNDLTVGGIVDVTGNITQPEDSKHCFGGCGNSSIYWNGSALIIEVN